jgi:YidC/Oxa1 family membrane protein insertase
MWDFIINPFVTVLTLLYSLFGNDVVLAITAFTVIIRLATSPLVLQQQRSTNAMQELKPELDRLKEKYKGDREKFAQAQMELYRAKGINPMGGCLPLLVQLPIIFGLYGAILMAMGATPFQVIDLSGRLLIPGLDNLVPLNKIWLGIDITQAPQLLMNTQPIVLILPVLVMVTTWLQSKLTLPAPTKNGTGTPNPAEQMTRSMTTFLPIMYGFFALSFSVGLSIYFIVSNVVGIIQYTLLGKANWRGLLGLPPKVTPAQAAANRQASDELIKRVVDAVESKPKRAQGGLAAQSALSARPNAKVPSSPVQQNKPKKKK